MLSWVRRYKNSWLSIGALFALAFIFSFWGIGTNAFNRIKPVATVDGNQILAEQVNQRATEIRENIQRLAGAQASEVLKNINLRQQALDSLIDSQVVTNRARQLGIVITDNALQQKISGFKAFQRDGQFDFDIYQQVLGEQNMAPHDFEDQMRNEMLSNALQSMIDAGVQVAPDEVRHAFDLANEKVGFSYVTTQWTSFTAGITPSDSQLKDYYEKNSGDFREPDKVQIVFIHYDPQKLAATVEPPQADIEAYYKRATATLFTHPEQVHARHVLISVQSGATPAAKAAAQAKANDVLAQAQKGANFADLAKKYSDDPGTKFRGGDLDWFGRGSMVKPFEDAVFLMAPGTFTVVETGYGFHVVNLIDKRPAQVDTLEQARPKIIESLRAEEGAKIARKAIEDDLGAASGGTALDALAKQRGLDAVTTPMSSIADGIKGEANSRDLLEAAMRMDIGAARVVPSGDAPYLVKVVAREASHIAPLKDVEAKVRDAYVREAAIAAASVAASKFLEQVKSPLDFDSVARANHLEVKTIEPFARSRADVPGVGQLPELVRDAGVATTVPSLIDQVIDHTGDSYVFELTSRAAPGDDEWKAGQDEFTKDYLDRARKQAWTRYLDELKDHAQIKIDAEQLGASESSS